VPHLDALLAADVDIINCIRPFPGGINDMRVLKRRVGDRLCLWGGVNPEEDIESATVAHIRRAVIDVILVAAAGGGFVLSPGGSLYDPKPYENVITFIRTALEFGRYPIDSAYLEAELGKNG
jgi:uroporphyrinogen decarboxylase